MASVTALVCCTGYVALSQPGVIRSAARITWRARWQFGITTVYHFIFVPLTIGLAPLVALMQTAWVVTGRQI
jgi:hypothetical protein